MNLYMSLQQNNLKEEIRGRINMILKAIVKFQFPRAYKRYEYWNGKVNVPAEVEWEHVYISNFKWSLQ